MNLNQNRSFLIILILVPYIYLFPHTFKFIEMGNDFELLYYSYKKYIFEFFRVGFFPMWSPSESLGYSLVFNPFAQYFYPPSWLLYILCFFLGDFSKYTYFLYTVFGISIYNLGQFFWLKSLGINKKYCFYATIITCLGLKLTEILRFPNAIHAFAWFPLILYGITINVKKKLILKPSIIIFISTYLIISAGYPYYILYALILFPSYFFFINLKIVRKQFFSNNDITIPYYKNFLCCCVPAFMAVLLLSPWLAGIIEIMDITRSRNLHDIGFSYILSSNFIDQLGSWILPPISYAEGYYYFGAIISLSLFFYFYSLINNLKINCKKEIYFTIFFIIFFLLNYQFSAAQHSYIFDFLWEKFEFIQNFRVFSRMNIILVPLFSVLICFSLKKINEQKFDTKSLYFILIITIIILSIQIYFLEFFNNKNDYWKIWQGRRLDFLSNNIRYFSFIFELYNNYIYSIFFIFSCIFFCTLKNFKIKKNFFYIILILVSGELFILANIQWAIPYKYYDSNGYNKLNINPLDNLKNAFFKKNMISEVKGNTYFRNNKSFNVNYFDDFGIEAHTKLVDMYFGRDGKSIHHSNLKKVKFFWGMDNSGRKIFYSDSISVNSLDEIVDKINQSEKENQNLFFKILYYDGDKVVIEVYSSKKGYIIFVDNWSPRWTVKVNGNKKAILKTLGTYKSVEIDVGKSIITFEYKPW